MYQITIDIVIEKHVVITSRIKKINHYILLKLKDANKCILKKYLVGIATCRFLDQGG